MDQNQGLGEERAMVNKPDSVWATTRWSWGWLQAEYRRLWAQTYRPFIVLVVVGLLGLTLGAVPDALLQGLVMVLSVLATALLAVATHRAVLVKPEESVLGGALIPSRREWRYVGYQLLVMAIMLLPLLVVGGLMGWLASEALASMMVFVPLLIFAVYVTLRWAFLYPAVAADKNTGIAQAWRESKGWVLQYVLASLVLSLPIFALLILGLLLLVLTAPEGLVVYYFFDVVATVMSAVGVWVAVVPLSIAYGSAKGYLAFAAQAEEAS